MINNLLEQKNYLFNNISTYVTGIYPVISLNSELNGYNNQYSTNYNTYCLNNTKLQSNQNDILYINNINNSNINIKNNYVVISQNNGSINNFPVPYYEKNNLLTDISKKTTVLYPTDKMLISKQIQTNGISTFFGDFSDNTLLQSLKVDTDNLANIKSISGSSCEFILAYNIFNINDSAYKISLQSILKELPKNMNGYDYIFNIKSITPTEIIKDRLYSFENFKGGSIYINFLETISATFQFINCDNIYINRNSNNNISLFSAVSKYNEAFLPSLIFDNCFNINIEHINFCKNIYTSHDRPIYGITGNKKTYNVPATIYFKNSHAKILSSKFISYSNTEDIKDYLSTYFLNDYITNKYGIYNSEISSYSIIGFNSKFFTDTVTFDSNLKLLMDEFSTITTNSEILTVSAYIEQNEKLYISNQNENSLINGTQNHFHTQYLPENNTIPTGSVIAYQYWYTKYQYDYYINKILNKYNELDISGLAQILAGNDNSQFPTKLLPLCIDSNNNTAYQLLQTYFYQHINILTGIYTDTLSSCLLNTCQQYKTIDFFSQDINPVFYDVFCSSKNTFRDTNRTYSMIYKDSNTIKTSVLSTQLKSGVQFNRTKTFAISINIINNGTYGDIIITSVQPKIGTGNYRVFPPQINMNASGTNNISFIEFLFGKTIAIKYNNNTLSEIYKDDSITKTIYDNSFITYQTSRKSKNRIIYRYI